VVRNGYLPERELQTGLGPVTVKIPKVRARTGVPVTFRSALVPPYVRKTRSLEAALPWLYLKGVSSGEMDEALKVLVGPEATGLSASTVSRLKQVWGRNVSNLIGTVNFEITSICPRRVRTQRL
jgi:transposase-like protein